MFQGCQYPTFHPSISTTLKNVLLWSTLIYCASQKVVGTFRGVLPTTPKRKINRKYHRTFHPDIHFNVDYMSAFLVILSPFFGAAPSVVRILFVVLRDGVEVRMDSKKI